MSSSSLGQFYSEMSKHSKSGLPYLQVSLRFDTQSTENVNVDALLDGLKEVLPSVISDSPPTTGPRGHEYKTDYVFVGLQSIFDDIGKGLIKYTLLDSQVFVPTGVGNAISLLITNCKNQISYAIPGLQDMLLDLGINSEAIGFSVKSDQVINFLTQQNLRPIEISKENKQQQKSELAAPVLQRSIGKSNKKNKKNKKK
ncbi:unnamed protein product [Auanema sp. JU1783]|nr:unnamed protein product [Auanema sp. JU1783]